MAGIDPLFVGGACERAREWSSLRLDDELSVLEEEILERHLAACAACREFDAGVRSATEALRSARAEVPSRRVSIPAESARRTVRRRRAGLLAAAALAAGALVGSLAERPTDPEPATPTQVSMLTRDASQLRELPRTRFTTPPPVPSTPPNPPEGVI
jgi:anti-sigma factor RsiW